MLTESPKGRRMLTNTAWFLVGKLDERGPVCHVPINTSPFSIGRRPDCALCLPYQTISGTHAEIVVNGDRLNLHDRDSTNGTYLNGQVVRQPAVLKQDDLIQFADVALRVQYQGAKNYAQTRQHDVYDQALALVQFDKLMSESCVTPHYQPIVKTNSQEVVGYEVLGRSRLYGVETPGAMFKAAAKLNLEVQLSQMLRWEGIQQSDAFATPPHLFVNTHPSELQEPGLIESIASVREVNPTQPLTLEIHEAAVSDGHAMAELRDALNDLNVRLAYDDFGSGQARLAELVEVRPDYMKFDISLIRDIHVASAKHQQMVASLVNMVRELDVLPLAEGIECEAESDTCVQLGFELGQGFFYGKPAPATCF